MIKGISTRLFIMMKLLVAISLLVLAWTYRPTYAQGACASNVEKNAACQTINECGEQACQTVTSQGNVVGTCRLVYLGGGCVVHGCYGSTCDTSLPEGPPEN